MMKALLCVLLGLFTLGYDGRASRDGNDERLTVVRFCSSGRILPGSFSLSLQQESANISRDRNFIRVYYTYQPESIDWQIFDIYIFREENGELLNFSRTIHFAEQPYVFSSIKRGEIFIDNSDSLPMDLFIPNYQIFRSEAEFCQHFE